MEKLVSAINKAIGDKEVSYMIVEEVTDFDMDFLSQKDYVITQIGKFWVAFW